MVLLKIGSYLFIALGLACLGAHYWRLFRELRECRDCRSYESDEEDGEKVCPYCGAPKDNAAYAKFQERLYGKDSAAAATFAEGSKR